MLKQSEPGTHHFRSTGGVDIVRTIEIVDGVQAVRDLTDRLDSQRGVLLRSSFEYPGRYQRYDIGFVCPPLVLEGRGRTFALSALNERGRLLLQPCEAALRSVPDVQDLAYTTHQLTGVVAASQEPVSEEERTRQPSLLTVVRALRDLFASNDDATLGLYGAFGYDLVFSIEELTPQKARDADQRDLVLYLPDDVVVIDHRTGLARRLRYDFHTQNGATTQLARSGASQPYRGTSAQPSAPHGAGSFAQMVQRAHQSFARGDLFEVTPSQVFQRPCPTPPSALFSRLCTENPAPYGFLMNLGQSEYLVGASPEMYVRVEGGVSTGARVETCPIAGTIARGRDALDDAAQIRALLVSEKEESELTMCTDVDRNDKARVCQPGSVRVIGRRQLELYSRLIHTVDHVEGRLRDGYDALDAFATHLWAVTVTGAPKLAAMRFIEAEEETPRRFYGGAVGMVGFDGGLNTGLTLRTLHIRQGVAEVRAGATLLFESDPDAEERESELKASALLAVLEPARKTAPAIAAHVAHAGRGKRVLLVDHEDSFVHTLADYFRQTGAQVTTLRAHVARQRLPHLTPDLVVLSPGPGRPEEFDTSGLLSMLIARNLPAFGVCLGLQAMAEHFGGSLAQLATPVHGKSSRVRVLGGALFQGLPAELTVGRYHSLHAERARLPAVLRVDAESEDGVIMAISHRSLPLCAVQFHPESIMSSAVGLTLISNVMAMTTTARVVPPQSSTGS